MVFLGHLVALWTMAPMPAPVEPLPSEESNTPVVAVGPATFIGDADGANIEVEESELRSAVAAGLERGSVPSEILDSNCQDRSCWLTLAREQGIETMLFPVLERRGPDHHITLEVIALKEGSIVAQIDGDCEICGRDELLTTTTDLSATLSPRLHRLETSPALVVLRGSPAGATVEIDGEVVGTVPWEGELSPGEHTVVISHDHHVPLRRVLVANAGIREHLDVALQPDIPPTPTPTPTPTNEPPTSEDRPNVTRLAIGSALAGTGLLTLGGGIGLFAYDGRPHQPSCLTMGMDANGRCPIQHETTNAGIATTVVGGAALIAGVALVVHTLVSHRDRAARSQARVQPRLGGLTLRF